MPASFQWLAALGHWLAVLVNPVPGLIPIETNPRKRLSRAKVNGRTT